MKRSSNSYNTDTSTFSDSIEVVVDDMKTYLIAPDYDDDQVEELAEQLTDMLECTVSEFLDDVVESVARDDEEEDDE